MFEEAARDVYAGRGAGTKYLVQGTLYPDVIESGSDTAATIKSHHNVGGPARGHRLRAGRAAAQTCSRTRSASSARSSGLPEAMVWRQPFPGPGLAVRIVGDITRERLDLVRAADRIVLEELRKARASNASCGSRSPRC